MSSNRGFRHLVLRDDEINDTAASRVARKNRRKRNLTFLCISAVIIIIIALFLGLYFGLRKKDERGHICVSPDLCNTRILDYIDGSYDPCDNFYAYSCGGWLADNPLNNHNALSIFSDLFVDNYQHLRNYLSSSVQGNDLAAIKKSKYIYSSCANVGFIKSSLKDHIQTFIKDAGGWSDIGIFPDNGWDINSDLVNDHYKGSSALFEFSISSNDSNSSEPVIRVSY